MAIRPIDELVKDDRLHRTIYNDPEIFEEELRRIFYTTWLYIGHESEIAQPGDYKTARMGLVPVILSRSADGQINLLIHRCMHRGTTVCQRESGNEIRHGQKSATGQKRQGDQRAMIRPHQEADPVRYHEADEPDHSGDRDAGCGDQGRDQEREALHPLDVGSEVIGRLLTYGHQVERSREPEQDDGRRNRICRSETDASPTRSCEAAHDP